MSFFKDFKNDLSQVVGNSDQATSDAASAVAMAEEVNTVSDQIDTLVLDDFEKDSRQEVIPEMVSEPIMAEAPIEELAINDISMEEQVTVIPEITPVAETPAEPVAAEMPIAEPVIEAAPIVEPVIEAAPIVEPIAEPVIEEAAPVVETAVAEAVAQPAMTEAAPIIEDVQTSIGEDTTMSEIDNEFENAPATDESAVITEGMTVTGDITSTGNMDVLGKVKGNVDIKGKLTITGTVNGNSKAAEIFADSAKITGNVNSSGSVKVGQSSVIVGDIFATSAVIAGAVKGSIDVHGPVILDTSAIVMGDIKSKSVQINNGAVIEGHCSQCYAEVSPTSFFSDIK